MHRAFARREQARLYKKRRYQKKKLSKMLRRSWRPSRIPTVCPPSTYVKLPLIYRFKIDAGANDTPDTQLIKANSCYDPLGADAKFQPLGLSTYFALYNEAVVHKATIHVEFLAAGNTVAQSSAHITLACRDDTTLITDVQTLLTPRNFQKTKMLPINPAGTRTLSLTVPMKKFFGTKELDDQYQFTNSADANEGAHFHISCVGMENTATDPDAVYCLAKVYYYIKFTEPKDLATTEHA